MADENAELPPVPTKPEPEVPVVTEYTDENGHGVKLHQDGTVTIVGIEKVEDLKDILAVLMVQFTMLSQLQNVVQEAIKLDLKGAVHLVTGDDKNLDLVEMLKERIVQTNRAYVIEVRRRAGEQKKR